MTTPACRRCGRELSDIELRDHGAGSRLSVSTTAGYTGRRCPACGWVNVEHVPNVADLTPLEEWFGDLGLELPDSADAQTVQSILRDARGILVSELRRLVLDAPYMAISFLLEGVASVGSEMDILEEKFVLGLQQVYACLATRGPMPVFSDRLTGYETPWAERVGQILGATTVLSSLVREIRLESLKSVDLHGGRFTAEFNDRSAWAFEVNANGVDFPIADPLAGLSPVDEIEREVFAASTLDLLGLLASPDVLSESTRVSSDGDLIYVDLESEYRIVSLVRDHCLLSGPRWLSRSVPSFFFADERGGHRTEQAMVAQAGELDWLRYAPLLCGGYAGAGGEGLVGVTSRGLVERSVARSGGSLASRLHLAEKAARHRSPGQAAEISRRMRAVHQEFENRAAQACRSRGIAAVAGVEFLAGRPLPCGEIDLLGYGRGDRGGVLIVGECKNVDLTFYKDLGMTQAAETIERAAGQARRKATWAAEHWSSLGGLLEGLDAEPVVVPIVVTRLTAFPTTANGVPVLAVRELNDAVGMLIATGGAQWWGGTQ